ncbi:MAG: type II toxin-antitoxin system HipA family toxin [Deltaproteobacteria bacterium]|nr:type II toxin-antitoxin system HipA family toxin [Deltaproteobacteria bacterium]
MKRRIQVCLGHEARPLGVLRHDSQGSRESASFEYDPDWLTAADRFTVDPTLPLVAGAQYHRQAREGSLFHGAIADTEPDGWSRRVILRDHAKARLASRRRGESSRAQPLHALDFLLAVDDLSRVGALRFQDESGTFQRATEPGRRTAPPLIELGHLLAATRAVESNNETAADLAYLRGKGTSLGGMRPKCSVLDSDSSLSVGKFPSVSDERPVTRGEVLALRLAKLAGISAAQARIVDSDGIPVALIRRFDRREGGGRIMYISAATMLGVDATEAAEHAYTEIVDAIRMYGAAARADIEELWRRIAFSILITNVDDHLRNHGFLHVGHGQWRLAPAFDINPFPDRVRELKTWISEDTGPEATIDALLSVAPYFRISSKQAATILGEVEGAVATWRKQGRALGMSAADLDSFRDAFEHPQRRAARKAAGGKG